MAVIETVINVKIASFQNYTTHAINAFYRIIYIYYPTEDAIYT